MTYIFDIDGTLTPSRLRIDETFERFFLNFINYKFTDLPYQKLDKLKSKGMLILSYTAKSKEDLEFVQNRYDNAVFEGFEPIKKG